MSADSVLVFYGHRYPVTDDEVSALELRKEPRQLAARRAKLDAYWGNFGHGSPAWFLFVGAMIASAGAENPDVVSLPAPLMTELVAATNTKLKAAGLIDQAPCLWVQHQADM